MDWKENTMTEKEANRKEFEQTLHEYKEMQMLMRFLDENGLEKTLKQYPELVMKYVFGKGA